MTTNVIDLDDTDENANWLRKKPVPTGENMVTAIQQANAREDIHRVADAISAQPNGSHPLVRSTLEEARAHADRSSSDLAHRHHHIVHARAALTHGIGLMATLNAMTNNNAADSSAGPAPPVDVETAPVAVQQSYEQVFGEKFNSNHDERGRFSSGGGAGVATHGGAASVQSAQTGVTWKYTLGHAEPAAQVRYTLETEGPPPAAYGGVPAVNGPGTITGSNDEQYVTRPGIMSCISQTAADMRDDVAASQTSLDAFDAAIRKGDEGAAADRLIDLDQHIDDAASAYACSVANIKAGACADSVRAYNEVRAKIIFDTPASNLAGVYGTVRGEYQDAIARLGVQSRSLLDATLAAARCQSALAATKAVTTKTVATPAVLRAAIRPMTNPVAQAYMEAARVDLAGSGDQALIHAARHITAATLIEDAPGPVSKYNPNHDERGRFASGDAAGGLASMAHSEGGFSYAVPSGRLPRSGYMFSTPGAEKVYGLADFDAAKVKDYINQFKPSLDQPGHYLGGWYSKEDGNVYLDISENVPDVATATKLGVERNQWGVYDVANKAYLPVESLRQQAQKLMKPSQDPSDMVVVWLDPEDPEGAYQKIMALVTAHGGDVSAKYATVFGQKFNPNHDERGRFTSGADAASAASSGNDPVSAKVRGVLAGVTPAARARVQHVIDEQTAMVADGQTTQQLWDQVGGIRGAYTPEVEAKLNAVVKSEFDRQVAGGALQDKRLAVIGGLGGAGKTTLLAGHPEFLGVNPDEYVTVNPDDMKALMAQHGLVPGYGDLSSGELSGQLHETSADMAAKLADLSLSQGYNTLYDITLGSPQKAGKILDEATRYGYDPARATAGFVDVSVDKSLGNAVTRWSRGGTYSGRFVNPYIPARQLDPTGQYNSMNRRYFNADAPAFGTSRVVNNEDYAHPVPGPVYHFGQRAG